MHRIDDLMAGWGGVRSANLASCRNKHTQLLLDSLRVVPAMSPSDVCLLITHFEQSNLTGADSGLDPVLIQTFSELLEKIMKINCDCLCLTDLFTTYVDLLQASTADRSYVNPRERFAHALLSRMRASEEVPQNFPVVQFLDSFVGEIDSPILETLSQWACKSVHRISSPVINPPHGFVDSFLAIQDAFHSRKIPVSDLFISAVRKLVS